MNEEKKCEHEWVSIGISGVSGNRKGSAAQEDWWYRFIAAIFCTKCGEIKLKLL